MRKDMFKLKPKHKWFAATYWEATEGWYGPHNTIESALFHCATEEPDMYRIYICQGRKLSKKEKEEWGVAFDWQVDIHYGMKVGEHHAI